ncbi:hypothetical protein KQI63_16640 [bacterium]|nr:hypothetical protein [bacterium]
MRPWPFLVLLLSTTAFAADLPDPVTVPIFQNEMIHFFDGDSASAYASDGVRVEDNGRIIVTDTELPTFDSPIRIEAHLTLHPIPKPESYIEVYDKWDRAGSIRLRAEGQPDIELMRFMTSYGGETSHTLDVTRYAPLLKGKVTIAAFIDTWVSPAWHVDVSLEYLPVVEYDNATWASGVYLEDSFNAQEMGDGVERTVTIPEGLKRVVMSYISTGHCTDGTDEDEFVSKANIILVDEVVVHRFYPWRDDCQQYRARNPYTRRWNNGTWSSDYSRSGWCPGVEVNPEEIDLTDHLTPGTHTIQFVIEDMRPIDENNHFGYWRVSSALVGWDKKPKLWQNFEE